MPSRIGIGDLSLALIDTPEAANRLARAIASDISLYNEEKIKDGIRNDDLFDVLSTEIDRGLSLYKRRISPNMFEKSNYYYRAIVDILVKSQGAVESPIW